MILLIIGLKVLFNTRIYIWTFLFIHWAVFSPKSDTLLIIVYFSIWEDPHTHTYIFIYFRMFLDMAFYLFF